MGCMAFRRLGRAVLVAILGALACARALSLAMAAGEARVAVWGCDPHDWVVHSTPPGSRAAVLRIEQSVNEYEMAAFAVTNGGSQPANVRLFIACPQLLRQSREALRLYRVVEIQPDPAVSPACEEDYRSSGRPLPEVLDPVAGAAAVGAGHSQQFWLTSHAAGVRPGTYGGYVAVSSGAAPEQRVPLAITVWPITLPQRTALSFFTWEYTPGPPDLARAYARLLVEHYVNMAWLEYPNVKADGSVDADTLGWGVRARIMRDAGLTPVLAWGEAARIEAVYAEMDRVGFREWYHEVFDEPTPGTQAEMLRTFERMRAVKPSVRILTAFNEGCFVSGDRLAVLRALAPFSSVWLTTRGGQYSDIFSTPRWKGYPDVAAFFAGAQAKGVPIWYYHNSWRAPNHPGGTLAWTRPDGWYIWHHGIDGVAPGCAGHTPHADRPFWQAAAKPFSVPVERQSYVNNGYVRRRADGSHEVLGCKRLAGWRSGIQDHMYLSLLEHLGLAARRAKDAKRAAAADAALAGAYRAVSENVGSWDTYVAQKRRIAEAIIGLQKAGYQVDLRDGVLPRAHPYRPEERSPKVAASAAARYTRASANLIVDGSFEGGAPAWLSETPAIARTQEDACDGGWSLRFQLAPDASESYRQDWVRAAVNLPRVPVRRGHLVRLSARVRVPGDLKDTGRGLSLSLRGFFGGKPVEAYDPLQYEVGRATRTSGWQTLAVYLMVDDPPCDEVQARIGLCGAGTAYVDAVELATLRRP